MKKLKEWLDTGKIVHDLSSLTCAENVEHTSDSRKIGQKLAEDILRNRRIMGQFVPAVWVC
jgi:hypothetical protein